jgi:hypothetical protein
MGTLTWTAQLREQAEGVGCLECVLTGCGKVLGGVLGREWWGAWEAARRGGEMRETES